VLVRVDGEEVEIPHALTERFRGDVRPAGDPLVERGDQPGLLFE